MVTAPGLRCEGATLLLLPRSRRWRAFSRPRGCETAESSQRVVGLLAALRGLLHPKLTNPKRRSAVSGGAARWLLCREAVVTHCMYGTEAARPPPSARSNRRADDRFKAGPWKRGTLRRAQGSA